MEPLTTFALVAAFMAPVPVTRRPEWVTPARVYETTGVPSSETELLVAESLTAETEEILSPLASAIWPDRKVALATEIRGYGCLKAGWDGEGSAAPTEACGEAALAFIDAFPGGLPLPKAMVSSAGHLGFYWDFETGYADLNFDESGIASFFSRRRDGFETYVPDLPSDSLNRAWAFQHLGELAAPAALAA